MPYSQSQKLNARPLYPSFDPLSKKEGDSTVMRIVEEERYLFSLYANERNATPE